MATPKACERVSRSPELGWLTIGAGVVVLRPTPATQAACAVVISSNIIVFLYATILLGSGQLSSTVFRSFSFTIDQWVVWFYFPSYDHSPISHPHLTHR
jgi:hypothetical protein